MLNDFFGATPRCFSAVIQWAFEDIHGMLGIPLKVEKGSGPASVLQPLGLEVAAALLWSGVRLTQDRRTSLLHCIELALRQQHLTCRDASQLGGQLQFATSALFGHVGRAFAAIICRHAGGWSNVLQYALLWWRALLQVPLHRVQHHGSRPVSIVAWADGSWDVDEGCGAVGAMLLSSALPENGLAISAVIPEHLHELRAVDKKRRNTQAELLAQNTFDNRTGCAPFLSTSPSDMSPLVSKSRAPQAPEMNVILTLKL